MIVWGGLQSDVLNTGGQYDPVGDSWMATNSATAPAPRFLHTAVWTGTKMIIWGGFDGMGLDLNGSQYDPGTDSWTATITAGAPSARAQHSAVWTGTKMIVWGGSFGGTPLDTGAEWSTLSLYRKN